MFASVLGVRIETRFRRRLMVAVTYASYIALAAFGGLARGSSGLTLWIGVLGTAVAGLVLCACWWALARLLREYGFPGDSRLFTSRDERQAGVRQRAFVRAYWILTGLICAGVALGLPGAEYRKPILFGLIFLCTSLPSAIIAWTEPDDEPDTIAFERAQSRA